MTPLIKLTKNKYKNFIRTIIIIKLKYLTKLVTGVFSWKKMNVSSVRGGNH